MHAKIPTKVGTLAMALSQAPSFRRCGLVYCTLPLCVPAVLAGLAVCVLLCFISGGITTTQKKRRKNSQWC